MTYPSPWITILSQCGGLSALLFLPWAKSWNILLIQFLSEGINLKRCTTKGYLLNMMSKTINRTSASGHGTQSLNPPIQSFPDDSMAGAQYLQAPTSSKEPTIQASTSGLNSGLTTGVRGNESSLARQEGMDVVSDSDTNDKLSGLDELFLYETDEEDITMVSSKPVCVGKKDSELETVVIGDTKETNSTVSTLSRDETKRVAGFKRSLRYLKQLGRKAPADLSVKEKRLKRKHEYHVRKYESQTNTAAVVVRPPKSAQDQSKAMKKPDITGLHSHSDARKTDSAVPSGSGPTTTAQSEISSAASTLRGIVGGTKIGGDLVEKARCVGGKPKEALLPSSSRGGKAVSKDKTIRSGGKRQRSGETQVSEGKRLKSSTSLPSAPELQVAIIDRSHPEGRMTTDRWLLLEERILRALVDALALSEDDSFTEFDGAKWQKGVKIVGCCNEKALNFLKNCIQQFDAVWPGMNVEIVPLDQVPCQTTVKVWIPPPVIEDESILTLMKRQNKGLDSDGWRIIRGRVRDKGDGKDLWLKVGQESLRLLRLSKGVLKYGLNHLKMILPEGGKQ